MGVLAEPTGRPLVLLVGLIFAAASLSCVALLLLLVVVVVVLSGVVMVVESMLSVRETSSSEMEVDESRPLTVV